MNNILHKSQTYCLATLYIILFLIGTETFLVSPLLPVIAKQFNQSVTETAKIVSAYVLSYAIIAPFLAGIADRFSRRKSILWGALFFIISNFLAASAWNISILVLARAVGGIGAALAGPAIWALIADLSSAENRSRLIGLGMASFSLGQVAGVPAGGVIAQFFGWQMSFAVIGMFSTLALLFAMALLPRTISSMHAGLSADWLRNTFSPWGKSAAMLAFVVTILFQSANLGAYAYLGSILAGRFSFDVGQLGAIGLLVGVGSVIGAMLGGRWGDLARKNHKTDASRLPLWTLLLGGALLVVGTTSSVLISFVAIVFWFLASGAFVTDLQTLLANAMPDARALSSSWNTSSMHFGTAAGVWLMGNMVSPVQGLEFLGPLLAMMAFATSFFLIKTLSEAKNPNAA